MTQVTQIVQTHFCDHACNYVHEVAIVCVCVCVSVCVCICMFVSLRLSVCMCVSVSVCVCTVDRKRFTGLYVCGFNPIKVFVEILLHCLGQKCLLFNIIKERCLNSWENFHGIFENHEECESSAQ